MPDPFAGRVIHPGPIRRSMASPRSDRTDAKIELDSTVRCPKCGFESLERMPTRYCLVRYECRMCGYIMTPKEGKCCIFCSYGEVACPPEQEKARSSG